MTRVRDHYFEVRKDGTYIYLGSTNPERIDRGEETDMFFSGGIDNPVCVIRGQMATIQPPEPVSDEDARALGWDAGSPAETDNPIPPIETLRWEDPGHKF